MEKKIMKPKGILYVTNIIFLIITFFWGVLFLLIFFIGGGILEIISGLIIILILWIIQTIGIAKIYCNNQMEIINGEKIVLDQKVREWRNIYNKTSNGNWIHQRIEINSADVIRIGCSYDLYGKCFYYHTSGVTLSMYQEVVIEMKGGKRAAFDSSFYTRKQLREIIGMLCHNEEVQVTGYLRKVLGKHFFE